MNQLAGFVKLLVAALLIIVSSVTNVKVTAQGNSSSSEKPTTAANGSCSPELFKEKPAECAVLYALKHTSAKGSGASAEKAAETGSSPIEVKKLPTMEVKTNGMLTAEKLEIKKRAAETGKCSAGKVKDWAGVCFPESEAKACPTCAPGSAATSAKPMSENCLQTTTRSGESLCITAATAKKAEQPIPEMSPAYEVGRNAAKAGDPNPYIACWYKLREGLNVEHPTEAQQQQCRAGYESVKATWEAPKCNQPAGIGSPFRQPTKC